MGEHQREWNCIQIDENGTAFYVCALCGVMSALGQKPTYAVQNVMSALPPIATAKADIRKRSCPLYPRKRTCAVQPGMSALGQKRTWMLFDHLVSSSQQRGRNGKAEHFCCLEIDHEFVFGRRLHRHVGWLLTLEDTVDIIGRAPERIDCRSPIGNQTAGLDKEAINVDRGQPVPGGEPDDQSR